MNNLLAVAVVLTTLATAAVAQSNSHPIYPIATFDQTARNRLGGTCRTFERAPSSATVHLAAEVFHGEQGRSLCVTANRSDTGFCGISMQLFNGHSTPTTYFDSDPYTHVSFWVRGDQGGEDFTVRLADRLLVTKEDSVAVGPVTEFLPGGVSTQWQNVLVPLDVAWRLDRSQLAGLTLEFHRAGRHQIYIDDISLVAIADKPAFQRQPVHTQAKPPPSHPKAMWVWHTPEMLRLNAAERADFFAFCQQEGIEHLWMQLLYVFETAVDLGPPEASRQRPDDPTRCVVRAQKHLRRFIQEAHQARLKVYALDGYPEFVQKEYHHCPLAIVDAVIAFNDRAAPNQRYDGVHFDNEPHLLVGWANLDRRRQILKEFLDLVAQCQQRVRERSKMRFGIDIPFWWQHVDPKTGQMHGVVDYNGKQKAASYHCIDMVDSVGIMNYRDTADGPDGMVAHGNELLDYGDTVSGATIHMGLETIADMDTAVWFVVGLTHARFAQALNTTALDFSYLSRVDDFRIRTFDDGTHIHVGLEMPPDPTPDQQHRFDRAMEQIAKRFAHRADDPSNKPLREKTRTTLLASLSNNAEWKRPTARDIHTRQRTTPYAVVSATHLMHPKITFGDNSYDHFRTQTQAAEASFKRHRSYGGFAIHYYRTYQQMVTKALSNP